MKGPVYYYYYLTALISFSCQVEAVLYSKTISWIIQLDPLWHIQKQLNTPARDNWVTNRVVLFIDTNQSFSECHFNNFSAEPVVDFCTLLFSYLDKGIINVCLILKHLTFNHLLPYRHWISFLIKMHFISSHDFLWSKYGPIQTMCGSWNKKSILHRSLNEGNSTQHGMVWCSSGSLLFTAH